MAEALPISVVSIIGGGVPKGNPQIAPTLITPRIYLASNQHQRHSEWRDVKSKLYAAAPFGELVSVKSSHVLQGEGEIMVSPHALG